ncbi:ATP-binding protein [Streptomyces echinatus]|uniref:Anti-sigma regulatory factor (Ser/Thr protein kinase) n=1 Tax=Streptomyces echinatus TaxID=67293 RepID=A0A7W9PT49_9ACTN|nr:ATP-binding protein [Streptomyces echinatus]MBB5927159.1 anti-sigma regulatory factor (Ser/Thr protein kinase) [Streptomyces echinatus]
MNVEISTPTTELVQRLSATPRGARLARRLTGAALATWGYPHEGDLSHTAQLIVAELAANAVTHGRVPGRDFELRLGLLREKNTLRIEVSDARGDRKLRFLDGRPEDEHGRGLVVVQVLASLWGVSERDVGKTVWVELSLSPRQRPGTPRPCPRRPGPAG